MGISWLAIELTASKGNSNPVALGGVLCLEGGRSLLSKLSIALSVCFLLYPERRDSISYIKNNKYFWWI